MKIRYTRHRNIREIVTYEVEVPDDNSLLVEQVNELAEWGELGDSAPGDLDQYVCDNGTVVADELGSCDEENLDAFVEVTR